MFARIKKSGKYEYLQIVENRKENGNVKQRVIATIGRMDQLHPKGRVETLIRSLSKFSEQTLDSHREKRCFRGSLEDRPVSHFRAAVERDRHPGSHQRCAGGPTV